MASMAVVRPQRWPIEKRTEGLGHGCRNYGRHIAYIGLLFEAAGGQKLGYSDYRGQAPGKIWRHEFGRLFT